MTIWPVTVSALSTVDICPAAVLPRSASITLPGPEALAEPATTVPRPTPSSCWARVIRPWLAGSETPPDGGADGATTTASVAGTNGRPVMLSRPACA